MHQLIIVPLCAPAAMTRQGRSAIEHAKTLFIQTARHPSADAVAAIRRDGQTMDDLFESCEDFDELNQKIAQRLTGAGDCVYVATGNIFSSQLPSIRKLADAQGVGLQVLPHVSAGSAAFPDLPGGLSMCAHELPKVLFPDRACIVEEIDSKIAAGDAKLALMEYYPDEWCVTLASVGKDGQYKRNEILLCALDRQPSYDATTIVYVPPVPFEQRTRYGFEDVMQVVRRLRAPGGCPWDREQTHESLKNALLEECYELIDAIDEDDDAHICEELGDVLLQFAMHAVIAEEQRAFTDRDAETELVEKLVYRHPHVFGSLEVNDSGEVLKNWDALKMKQRSQATQTEVLKSVPKGFPALLRSRKVQKKAADVGFDWPDANEAFFKITEETQELKQAMEEGSNIREEMGDLLFAVVNVARLLKLEPEFLLMEATDKFIDRFSAMEQLAHNRNTTLRQMTLQEMDALWEEAKKSRIVQ
jgi:tetrapyrrole methylase family protein/MazG family protein